MSNSDYVTTTAVDLSSLGRVKDHIYYREDEAQLTEIETQSNMGRYRKALTSRNFGSTGECLLPNLDGVEHTYLFLELQNLEATTLLCDSWTSHCIAGINIQLGSSNLSLQEKRGHTNFEEMWWSVETREKRDSVIKLGGEPKKSGVVAGTHKGVILLNLPFSSLKYNMKKRSFDASLLSSPILIQVTFKPITSIIGVVKDTVAMGGTAYSGLPTGFVTADIIVRQDVLTDKTQSLKDTLMRSDVFAVYPYVHVLSGTSRTQILANVGGVAPMQLDMTGFLNSDLLGIGFSVINASDLNSVIDSGSPDKNLMCNPCRTVRCRNIRLFYNGSTLFDIPHHLADLHAMANSKGDVTANVSTLTETGDLTSDTIAHQYYISFSAKMRNQFLGRLANVPRYSQQPIEIRFDVETTNNTPHTFRSSYYYNSVAMMSKGNSNIFFT